MSKVYYVYIMSNCKDGVLYIGVTNDLVRRVYEHKNSLADGFTKKYKLYNLVYYESYDDVRTALQREKNLKQWLREWKLEMVSKTNPDWKDLYPEIIK